MTDDDTSVHTKWDGIGNIGISVGCFRLKGAATLGCGALVGKVTGATLGSQQGIKIGALCRLLSLRGKDWGKHQRWLPWWTGEKKKCFKAVVMGSGVALVQAPL